MKNTQQEIASWVTKLIELELDCPSEAYELFIKEKNYALQAFQEGIKIYDLQTTIIKMFLETLHLTEALSFIDGSNEFGRKIEKSSFYIILDTVFSNIYREPTWKEVAKELINLTRNDKHYCFMTLGLEVDLELYGSLEEYKNALKKVDSILEKPPAFSFDSRYDTDSIAFKACIAAAFKKDFETAGKYMQIMLKANPKKMISLKFEIQNNEELEDFKKSSFFKQTKSLEPKEKFLQSAYENAEDEPYKVFNDLEKKKKTAKDLADLVSVQHYCIALICSDLEEHGESNIEEYGKGKVSPKEFKKIKKDLELELKDLMKEAKVKQTIFWQFKNFKNFKDVPF